MRTQPRLHLRRAWTNGGRLVYADSNFRPFDEIPVPTQRRAASSDRAEPVLTSAFRPQALS